MALRDTLEKNPKAVLGAAAGVTFLAIVWIIWYMASGSDVRGGPTTPKAYYTIDDGNTWFADDDVPLKVPPFDHGGKKAYKVLLWTCDGGQTKFVSGLVRYIPKAQTKLQEAQAANNFDDPVVQDILAGNVGMQVKLPKTGADEANWIVSTDRKAARIVSPLCPNGGGLNPVVPE